MGWIRVRGPWVYLQIYSIHFSLLYLFCFSRSCFYSFTIMLTVLNLYLKSWITTWVPHFAIQASTEHVHSSPAVSFNHVNWDSLPCLPDLGSPPLSSVLINGTTSTQLFKPETWNYLRPFLLPDFQHFSGTQILFSSHKFWLVSAFLLLLLDFRAPIPRVFHNSPVITSLYFSCNFKNKCIIFPHSTFSFMRKLNIHVCL